MSEKIETENAQLPSLFEISTTSWMILTFFLHYEIVNPDYLLAKQSSI